MKCYILVHPRPIGAEPTIYMKKPELSSDDDDYFTPDIVEFNSVFEAYRYVEDYLGSMFQQALDSYHNGKIKIVYT